MNESPRPLVLLIESHEPVVRLMTWVLTDAGFNVVTSEQPEQAIADVTAHNPSVVVFNTEMPPDAKAALVSEWRAVRPGLRVLDLEPRGGSAPRAVANADAVVTMPFDADTLVELVQKLTALVDDAR